MGCFSWMYADTNNKKALKIGEVGYLLCPDGTVIKEDNYDGYGQFQQFGVYELVAEWNRDYLEPCMLEMPYAKNWGEHDKFNFFIKYGFSDYINSLQRLYDYASKEMTDDEMEEKYGHNWKAHIGIEISCYDDQNAKLPYPIKITSKPCDYDKTPASKGDPNQGCDESDFYSDF